MQFIALNVPAPLLVKVTVPVGVVGVPDVSVTEAVHVVVWPIGTVLGLHERVVAVGAPVVTVKLKLPELPE